VSQRVDAADSAGRQLRFPGFLNHVWAFDHMSSTEEDQTAPGCTGKMPSARIPGSNLVVEGVHRRTSTSRRISDATASQLGSCRATHCKNKSVQPHNHPAQPNTRSKISWGVERAACPDSSRSRPVRRLWTGWRSAVRGGRRPVHSGYLAVKLPGLGPRSGIYRPVASRSTGGPRE
jgi:hypothetical protein